MASTKPSTTYRSIPENGDKDEALALAAKACLEIPAHAQAHSKLLIRTDSIEKSESLEALYARIGIRLGVIHSRKTLRANRATINHLQNDELEGVISIGVLGEGFDLPRLKIAVYHDQHKSLPATLQFIGRIARTAPGLAQQATLLAVRQDVMDDTRALYEEDAHWPTLIPALSEASIEREHRKREYIREFTIPEELDVSPYVLNPRPDVRVFVGDVRDIQLEPDVGLDSPYRVIYADVDQDRSLAVIITVRTMRPEWMAINSLDYPVYELHLVLLERRYGLLFVSTTSDANLRHILSRLNIPNLAPIKPRAINGVLSRLVIKGYHSVGLRSARPPGLRQPTYKMLAARHAEGTVTNSDGRAFGLGHAILTYDSEGQSDSIGVSIGKGKLWGVRGGSLIEFRDWCEWLASLLAAAAPTAKVPGMPILVPDVLEAFPAVPLVGFSWPTDAFELGATLTSNADVYPLAEVEVDINLEDENNLLLTLRSPDDDELAIVRVSVAEASIVVSGAARVQLVGEDEPLDIAEFLDEFEPAYYFADGTCIWGQTVYRVNASTGRVTDSILEAWDWSGTDRKRETAVPSDGRLNIDQATERHLIPLLGEDILIKDDASREIADYVLLRRVNGLWQAYLFHCKASLEDNAGARIHDLYEVCGQAVKSMKWNQHPDFLSMLANRIENRASTQILSGHDPAELCARLRADAAQNLQPSFRVHIVQPGVRRDAVGENTDLNTLLLLCEEWLADQGVDFVAVLSD